MLNLGYIMLGSEVMFGDPFALAPRFPAEALRRVAESDISTSSIRPAGNVSWDGVSGARKRHLKSRRQREMAMFAAIAFPVRAAEKTDGEPVLFKAHAKNARYTGEICGAWFEDGLALVAVDKAIELREAGCRIEICRGRNDD